MTIYDFNVKDAKGNEVAMADYKGKVLLIINSATECGFTPQYEALEKLYKSYSERGFEILDFPCNQFGHQAPGNEEDIQRFCTLKYKTTFKLFAKVDVNGPNAEPLFTFLKSQKRGGLLGSNIKWNFTKFLISRNGEVVARYGSTKRPETLANDIEKLL